MKRLAVIIALIVVGTLACTHGKKAEVAPVVAEPVRLAESPDPEAVKPAPVEAVSVETPIATAEPLPDAPIESIADSDDADVGEPPTADPPPSPTMKPRVAKTPAKPTPTAKAATKPEAPEKPEAKAADAAPAKAAEKPSDKSKDAAASEPVQLPDGVSAAKPRSKVPAEPVVRTDKGEVVTITPLHPYVPARGTRVGPRK